MTNIELELQALRKESREIKALLQQLLAGSSPSTSIRKPGEDLLHVIATQGAAAGVKFASQKLKGRAVAC